MNVELLQRIKQAILAEPRRLNMEVFFYESEECGTIMCIAGWACALAGEELHKLEQEDGPYAIARRARALLDIEEGASWHLFHGCPFRYARNVNAVAAVIDRLIDTGEVDWGAARSAASC